MREYELMVELPFLHKGNRFAFEDESGFVYRIYEDGKYAEYPLRQGLSGYLWLLVTEDCYLQRIN